MRALSRDTLSPPGDSSAIQICILLPQIKVPLLSHCIRERVSNVVPVGGSNLMSEMNDEAGLFLSHLLCSTQERKHERVEAGAVSALGEARGGGYPSPHTLTPGDKSLFSWRDTVAVTCCWGWGHTAVGGGRLYPGWP